jgi:CBS domain-containing protein
MGIIGNAISFGAGYALGAKKGYEPVKRGARRVGAVVSDAVTDRIPALGSFGSADGLVDVRQVREVMTAAPQTIEAKGTLSEAARMMRDGNIGDVIVTDGGRPIGIVTDRDIAVAIADGHDPATTQGREVIGDLVTVTPTDTVKEAMRRMRDYDIRRVPVVESGRVIGIVSLGDVSGLPGAAAVLADVSNAPPNG